MAEFYDDKVLDKLHRVQLEMLDDFMEICEKNRIRYFGFAGTGIGAVRHKGYIPWDDDIDLAVPRKDMERLIKIIERDYGDKYYILDSEHNENYPLMTTRLCLKGTEFTEHFCKSLDCGCGIFLDLYAYDNLADGKFAYNWQVWTAWFWSKLLILKSVKEPYLAQTGLKASIIKKVCAFIHHMLNWVKVPKKWLYERCYATCTRYNNRKTRRIGFPGDTNPNWNTLDRRDAFPTQKLEFEGRQLRFPRNVHRMLYNFYGDTYMTLPPVEKRKTHFPAVLDFGDGERYENE